MKVNFMIIGAQKCGTTTLFDTLIDHPSIAGCNNKEPHFFSTSKNWREELAYYESLFPETSEGVLCGEASTSYTFYPLRNKDIWDDIYEYNPKMKLIYIVRRPIDRIVSNYMHAYQRGYTDRKIDDAIISERFYLDVTRYYTQVIPFIRKFGKEQVHIIDFDDLVHDRKKVISELLNFLEIDSSQSDLYSDRQSNVSIGGNKRHHKYDNPSWNLRIVRRLAPTLWNKMTNNSERAFIKKPYLNASNQQMIINMLELEIKALEGLVNKDLSHWRAIQ